MKKAVMISTIITALAVLLTMISGLWIRANNVTDPGFLDFHRVIITASSVCCVITIALAIVIILPRRS